MQGRLYVGTSGFDYPEWKGSFYPTNLRRREMLAYYSRKLPSVEINYTFRHEAEAETTAAWAAATPSDFVFALKAHQRLTHWQRLLGTDDSLPRFLESARALRGKLGPILFQLPPNFKADLERLAAFVDRLPVDLRFAFEFRHDSWSVATPLLAERGVATCVSETDERAFDGELQVAPFVYLRLRRTSYGRTRLHAWAERVASARRAGTDVYCYFKHEEAGKGAAFASSFLRLSERYALAADTSASRNASTVAGSEIGSPSAVVT
jgi:uncharacterized protein YecE (DUF72 family)